MPVLELDDRHRAGALGRPVWVMTPSTAEWRYGHAGEGMPWYPSARLIRQERGADWSGVVNAIETALRQWSEAHVASAP